MSDHHELFLHCFGNLKPKHHFLLHVALLTSQDELPNRKYSVFLIVQEKSSQREDVCSCLLNLGISCCFVTLMRFEPVKSTVNITGAHHYVVLRGLYHFAFEFFLTPYDAACIMCTVVRVEVHETRYGLNTIPV